MASTRKLPDSDAKRDIALTSAKTKKDNSAPADIATTSATNIRLDAKQPLFAGLMLTRAGALQVQTGLTIAKNIALIRDRMYISHFIQGFNNGVERGVNPASHRAFFQLDVNSNSVPDLSTEALVILWGQRLINGDALRIAAGGAAMSNPTIVEVQTQHQAFIAINIEHSTAKTAYDQAQEAVERERPEVDKLILRIWDEVETFYNDEEPASKRRKAREWGIVYISTTVTGITGKAINPITATGQSGVTITLSKEGGFPENPITITDADGNYEFELSKPGTYIVTITVPDFAANPATIAVIIGNVTTHDFTLRAFTLQISDEVLGATRKAAPIINVPLNVNSIVQIFSNQPIGMAFLADINDTIQMHIVTHILAGVPLQIGLAAMDFDPNANDTLVVINQGTAIANYTLKLFV